MPQLAPGGLGRGVEHVIEAGQVAAEQLDLQGGSDQHAKGFQECGGQRGQREHGAQRQLPGADEVAPRTAAPRSATSSASPWIAVSTVADRRPRRNETFNSATNRFVQCDTARRSAPAALRVSTAENIS